MGGALHTGVAESFTKQIAGQMLSVVLHCDQQLHALCARSCPRLTPAPRAQAADGVHCTFEDVHGDISLFIRNKALQGSLFQVASQFNVLEMVSPDVGPEAGVTIYENAHTQGPACAIACPAGTVRATPAAASYVAHCVTSLPARSFAITS